MMDQQVEFQSTMNGKVLRSKTHQFVKTVFNFMELRGRVATFIIDPKKVIDRVSATWGVSKCTLTKFSE